MPIPPQKLRKVSPLVIQCIQVSRRIEELGTLRALESSLLDQDADEGAIIETLKAQHAHIAHPV